MLHSAEAKRDEAASVVLESGAGWTVVEDRVDNRMVITFEDKPEACVRAVLKAHGFRWSPTRTAWVRKLTDEARRSARQAVQARWAKTTAEESSEIAPELGRASGKSKRKKSGHVQKVETK